MSSSPATLQPKPRHFIRTLSASVFGSIALSLILASILVVWLNRTLTDTDTYVRSVAPLITTTDIQNFVAAKVTDSIVKSIPTADMAVALLPPADILRKTPEQLQSDAKSIVSGSVLQVVRSPRFQILWSDTNRSVHSQLVSQLAGSSDQLTLDLSPLTSGVVAELRSTKFAPVADNLDLPADIGRLNLKGGAIDKARKYYRLFHTATYAVVGATVLSVALCIWLSVEHVRTVRRILVGTGIVSLIEAILLQAPSLFGVKLLSPVDQKAAIAFAGALFHDLQLTLVIIGVSCIVLAVGSKIYSKYHASHSLNTANRY